MKLRIFAAIAAVSVTLIACDNTPKDGSEVDEVSAGESVLEIGDSESLSEVTDEELEMFVDISEQFMQMNQSAQGEMVEAVEHTGMEVERYAEIQQLSQIPDMDVDASGEELDQYAEASESIEVIQNRIHEEMVDVLKSSGLSEQWYENMVMKIQSDESVMSKYQQIMEERFEE